MRLRLYSINVRGRSTRTFTEPNHCVDLLRQGNPGVPVDVDPVVVDAQRGVGIREVESVEKEFERLKATYGNQLVAEIYPNHIFLARQLEQDAKDTERFIQDQANVFAAMIKNDEEAAAKEAAAKKAGKAG